MAVKAQPRKRGLTIPVLYSYKPVPADNALKLWTFDPALQAITSTLSTFAGMVRATRMWVPAPVTVSKLLPVLKTPGSGATALANCYLALFDKTGQRLGVSADQSTAWSSTNYAPEATLTPDASGSLTLPGGPNEYVFAAFLVGTMSTTAVALSAEGQGNQTTANAGLYVTGNTFFASGVLPRAFTFGTSLTAMPTSIDIAGQQAAGTLATSIAYWIGAK